MSKKEDAAYQAWLQDVKSKVPAEKRELFDQFISDEVVGKEIFRGGLREADYYRRLNELGETRREVEAEKIRLTSWYEAEKPKNQALLEKVSELEAKLAKRREAFDDEEDLMTDKQRAAEAEKISKLEKELAEVRSSQREAFSAFLPALVDMTDITHELVKGGWKTSPREVISYAQKNNVDPRTAFYALTADERTDRERDERKKQEEKWKEEGRREAMAKVSSPDNLRVSAGPTVVDQLRKPMTTDNPNERIKRASQAFSELTGASIP